MSEKIEEASNDSGCMAFEIFPNSDRPELLHRVRFALSKVSRTVVITRYLDTDQKLADLLSQIARYPDIRSLISVDSYGKQYVKE